MLELGGWNNDDGVMRLMDENGDELMRLSNEGMQFSYPDGSKFFVRCFNMGGAKLFIYPEQSGDLAHYFTIVAIRTVLVYSTRRFLCVILAQCQ